MLLSLCFILEYSSILSKFGCSCFRKTVNCYRCHYFHSTSGIVFFVQASTPAWTNVSDRKMSKRHVQSITHESDDEEICQDLTTGLPIADLFPDTTVLFANMFGLPAWSSTRDPRQVFTLLEAMYQAFETRHQLIVNSMMATDIVDPEQKNTEMPAGIKRSGLVKMMPSQPPIKRLSSSIEHLIQASDVAHMMQHWHIYRIAYKSGRSETDPLINWYPC
jgi:hypothetical protein